LLFATIILTLGFAFLAALVPPESLEFVALGWFVAEVLVVGGIVWFEARSAREQEETVKELQGTSGEPAPDADLDAEPAPPISSDPIRPR
jgi:hypothetical protein